MILMILHFFIHTSFAQNPSTPSLDMSSRLVELRMEVETLNKTLNARKENHENELRGKSGLRQEVESQLKREEIRAGQLNNKEKSLREDLAKKSVGKERLLDIFEHGSSRLTQSIEQGPPILLNKRVEAVKGIQNKLGKKEVSPERAIGQLWGLYEDEFRLARNISLTKEVIPLEGEQVSVDVAKVGMTLFYFQTPDNRYGTIDLGNKKWIELSGRTESRSVANLFQSLQKGISSGEFSLPVLGKGDF
jgi:hypothetical protein